MREKKKTKETVFIICFCGYLLRDSRHTIILICPYYVVDITKKKKKMILKTCPTKRNDTRPTTDGKQKKKKSSFLRGRALLIKNLIQILYYFVR